MKKLNIVRRALLIGGLGIAAVLVVVGVLLGSSPAQACVSNGWDIDEFYYSNSTFTVLVGRLDRNCCDETGKLGGYRTNYRKVVEKECAGEIGAEPIVTCWVGASQVACPN